MMPISRCPFNARPALALTRPKTLQARSLVISSATSNDIKNGMTLEIDGNPWKVIEFLHVKPGKGAAFVRSKLKNMKSGATVDKTFRAGEGIEVAQIYKADCQYSYPDGNDYVFMDMASYEETRVPRDEDWAKYLKEGTDCQLLFYNGDVISVDVPTTMELLVTQADPAVKGNTTAGANKPAILENGTEIQVPLFVNPGDIIKVDTRTDQYSGRVKE